VVGFYLGNDLANAYDSVYSGELWRSMRDTKFPGLVQPRFSGVEIRGEQTTKRFSAVREWLARHSVLYELVVNSPIGEVVRLHEMRGSARTNQASYVSIDWGKMHTALTPKSRLVALDLTDPRIAEGLRLSLELIRRSWEFCRQNNVHFLLVVIPTKERVFSSLAKELLRNETLRKLVDNETEVSARVRLYCSTHKISCLEVLDDLSAHATTGQIYPNNHDGHPNGNGYSIIAEAVKKKLEQELSK
jgi:hypothetical protein